jgi:hypothetical protein
MEDGNRTITLTFLYKIIDDNQATIRFLDTKAAFAIAVLGAMVGKILDSDELVVLTSHGPFISSVAAFFALLMIFAAFLGYMTVFPMVNPAENVSVPDHLAPKFFISKFSRKSPLRFFVSGKNAAMLETTHEEYCAALKITDAEMIESIAAAEVLKLSFIRQLKTDRLSALAKVLTLTVFLFIFLTIAAPRPKPAPAEMGTAHGQVNVYDSNVGLDGPSFPHVDTHVKPSGDPSAGSKVNPSKRKAGITPGKP